MVNELINKLDVWEQAVLYEMIPGGLYSVDKLKEEPNGDNLCYALGRLISMGLIVQEKNQYKLTRSK